MYSIRNPVYRSKEPDSGCLLILVSENYQLSLYCERENHFKAAIANRPTLGKKYCGKQY